MCREEYSPIVRYLVWLSTELAIIGSGTCRACPHALQLIVNRYPRGNWHSHRSTAAFWSSCLGWRCHYEYVAAALLAFSSHAWCAVFDTLTLLAIERFGSRALEFTFAFLIFVMAVTFFIVFGMAPPDVLSVLEVRPSHHSASPFNLNINQDIAVPTVPNRALVQAVGTLGAVIMPHNLFLHSALVQVRYCARRIAIMTRSNAIGRVVTFHAARAA